MSSTHGKVATIKKAKKLKIELHVAPRNGKARREVVARRGDKEFTDLLDTSSASAREKFLKRTAKAFSVKDKDALCQLDPELVKKAQEADASAEEAAKEAAAKAGNEVAADQSAQALENTPKDVIARATKFLNNPDLMEELANDIKKLGVAGETHLAQIEYVIGTSRLLPKPLGGSVQASSSSGKSYVTEIVTSLFPKEAVLAATDITPNALYYLDEGSLMHKLVFVGERKHASGQDDAAVANATLALREMMSRGRLDKYVPEKAKGGQIRTIHITHEGPIAYLETTTQHAIFEEDATRMLSLATDESCEQTAAIMHLQAKVAAGAATTEDEQQTIREKHWAVQRLLKKYQVRIPFAAKLLLPATMLVARRAFPQLLSMIEAVALLRQRQKKVRKGGLIYATVGDYEIGYELMLPVLQRTFASMSKRALDLYGIIRTNTTSNQTFDRSECIKWAGVGLTEVRTRLTLLVEIGLAEQVTGAKGVRYTYRLIPTSSAKPPSLEGLIHPFELQKAMKKAKNKTSNQTAFSPKSAKNQPIVPDEEE